MLQEPQPNGTHVAQVNAQMRPEALKNEHKVSISPLLKRLASRAHVEESDITAALALLDLNRISDAQRSLLLGLLQARRFPINQEQSNWLTRFIDNDEINSDGEAEKYVSIAPVLRQLLENSSAPSEEIAESFALSLDNRLTKEHVSLLLGLLCYTGLDRDPVILVKAASRMLASATPIDQETLRNSVNALRNQRGTYRGGLCDIVGTGGDGHSTFNVSTTASIIASSFLNLSKHGNRASSSTSGSADLLESIRPRGPIIGAVTADTLPQIYQRSQYAFLFAPNFHPGMRNVASLRKDIGIRTIFNVLGPLVNPVEDFIEARIVGVAERRLGPIFAEALRLKNVKKALVVCGAEDLDEISCAGKTYCWRLFEKDGDIKIDEFEITPADFGLSVHALSEVAGGKSPRQNADILVDLLANKLQKDDAVLEFVLINTAALLAIAGVCDNDGSNSSTESSDDVLTERGPGGQRWKEGVRLAREVLEKGLALESLDMYIDATHACRT